MTAASVNVTALGARVHVAGPMLLRAQGSTADHCQLPAQVRRTLATCTWVGHR